MQRVPLAGAHRTMGVVRSSFRDRDGPAPTRAGYPPPAHKAPAPAIATQPTITAPPFVLYFHPQCTNSISLLRQFQQTPISSVFLQDVRLLQQRPEWLNGTPMLVDTKMGLMYRGTDAIQFVTTLARLEAPTSTAQQPTPGLLQQPGLPPLPLHETVAPKIESPQHRQPPAEPGSPSLPSAAQASSMKALFELPDDNNSSIAAPAKSADETHPTGRKMTENQLQSYMTRRAASAPPQQVIT